LTAIGIGGAVGLEEPDSPRGLDLAEGLVDDAPHVALVVLVGAEDIEEFQPGDGLFQAPLQDPEIEDLLGIAVHVDGLQGGGDGVGIGKAPGAVPVCGGGAGVDEPDTVADAPVGEAAGVEVVVPPEIIRVPFRRGGAGPQMNDRPGGEGDLVGIDHLEKVVLVNIFDITQVNEILPLFRRTKPIDDDDVFDSLPVELPYEGAADEARAAGDHDHVCLSSGAVSNKDLITRS